MIAGGLPEHDLPPEFISAYEKLQRLFAGVLWDAKVNSCSTAWSDIKHAKHAQKRRKIFDEKAGEWREGSVKAIREWLPKYVALAQAFPEAVNRDPLQWAKDKVWKAVEGQCGIPRPREGGLLRVDSISRTMVYWFAVASEGNIKVNLPPLQPWTAPRWLARNGKDRDSLLRDYAQYLWLRLNSVIDEESNLAEVHRAINHSKLTQGQTRVEWEQARIAKEAPSSFSRMRGAKKPGRVPRLARDFVDFAGKLWLEAMRHCPGQISMKQLGQIGSQLDEKGYLPPTDYLEGRYARELKLFNSRNSNSKAGAIKTWTQLVNLADKDHLRGMRRLLSRCAET